MTSQEEDLPEGQKTIQTLEEICENTRTIRSILDRILDHLQEHCSKDAYSGSTDYDSDAISWKDLGNNDEMYA